MNKRIRQLAFGMMALYVLLFATTNYWQVGRASEINADPSNYRAIRREFDRPRGEILTYDGIVVAESFANPQGSTFPFRRHYPSGPLYAGVTGYYTFGFGATQVERTRNDVLNGQTGEQYVGNLEDIVTGGDGTGNVVLSLRNDLQTVARDALAGRDGSVVMLDVQTGAILAMYSNPTYDPNTVVDPDFDVAGTALQALLDDDDEPLLNHAYQMRYMPGSTFKVITTGIALEAGVIDTSTQFDRVTSWVPPQTSNPIHNYGGSNCGGDLVEVFRRSCNIPFAQTALEVGVDGMIAGTRAWGLERPIPIDLPRPAASTFGSTDDLAQQLPLVAMRGFGQQEDQMVPLHMAMVAAAVANGGVMMKPYVVHSTTNSRGQTLSLTRPEEWLRPISPQNAATLNQLMQGVVTNGTASCCLGISGIPIAAKTGTAQLNATGEPERSHAWIIGFAPADAPQYAVAVMLEDSDEVSASTGGRLAGPIAQRMFEAVFGR